MPINDTHDAIPGAYDQPDERDFIAEHILGASAVELPQKVNLNITPSHDQKRTWHCTSYAITHAMEILNTLERVTLGQVALADPEEQWANQKLAAGVVRASRMETEGDSLQNALNVLFKNGLNNKNTNIKTPLYQITGFARIGNTVDDIRQYLAKGYPIYTGSGNHCYLIVGYNDLSKEFICKNSYGSKWGSNGDGTFTVDYNDVDRFFTKYILFDKQEVNMIFKDVSEQSPNADAIKWALETGLMNGYGTSDNATDRQFLPEKPITRAEVAVVMQRLYNLLKK